MDLFFLGGEIGNFGDFGGFTNDSDTTIATAEEFTRQRQRREMS